MWVGPWNQSVHSHFIVPLAFHFSYQSQKQLRYLPAWLATRQPCGETCPPAPCLEWPAKQGNGEATSMIGRKSGRLAVWQSMSGQAGFEGLPHIRLT